MFESLSDRLQGALGELRGHGRLTPTDIDKAMREIRLALLEADVNFKVVGTSRSVPSDSRSWRVSRRRSR